MNSIPNILYVTTLVLATFFGALIMIASYFHIQFRVLKGKLISMKIDCTKILDLRDKERKLSIYKSRSRILFSISVFLFLLVFVLSIRIVSGETSSVHSFVVSEYIEIKNSSLSEELRKEISDVVVLLSEYYDLPWELITAISKTESNFNPVAESKVGAKGLMQVLTLEIEGHQFDSNRLFEVEYNINCGILVLKDKLKLAFGRIQEALYFYNGNGRKAYNRFGKKRSAYLEQIGRSLIEVIMLRDEIINARTFNER